MIMELPEPPLELPPRAIRWARVSGTVPPEQRVISGIVTAVVDTRLAFEVGRQIGVEVGGVRVFDLSGAGTANDVCFVVARELGLMLDRSQPARPRPR